MHSEYNFEGGKRGAVLPSKGKTRITIMLDDDILAHFRKEAEAEGTGYQTRINAILRAALPGSVKADDKPVTAKSLRKILREELKSAA
jgi:uncharacterized protein (DUF4415 family)